MPRNLVWVFGEDARCEKMIVEIEPMRKFVSGVIGFPQQPLRMSTDLVCKQGASVVAGQTCVHGVGFVCKVGLKEPADSRRVVASA